MSLNRNLLGSLLLTAAVIVSGIAVAQNTAKGTAKPARPGAEDRQSLFVITDQEGYGTGECLEKQGGCGKIIADSFCESKGFSMAEYYRKTEPEEITGTIVSERKPTPREPHAFVIGCK